MDMRFARIVATVIGLAAASPVTFAAPSAEDFAYLPTFADLEISPGGHYLAARVNDDNQYAIAVFDISGTNFAHVKGMTEDDQLSIRWFRWVTVNHLLVSMTFTGERGRFVKTTETRLFVINAETGALTAPFINRRRDIPVQIQDDVVSFLPHDPDHILLQYSRENPTKPDVYEVDITESKRHKRIQRGRPGVYDWMSDQRGEIRLGQGIRNEKTPYLMVRLPNERDWFDLSHRVSPGGAVFRPLAFADDPRLLFVASNHEGDPNGLYVYNFETDSFEELIFKHPIVDIANINVDDATGELISINFVDSDVETVYFAERPIDEDIRDFGRQYPGKDIAVSSVTDDGNYGVIRMQTPGDAGAYFLVDRVIPQVRQLPPQYPGLDSNAMGKTISTTYDARDGLSIPAFVTLPPGTDNLDAASRIPFVILPHGGPAARDFLRFDYWVQFLASRGYGVLQMNFRGSAGYGQSFQDAGSREWGQAMQDDITDGATWLVENGYADPGLIAIMGGSYGGYAALMGVVKTPDLYQCAISFAGVADLPDLLNTQRKYIGGRYSTRFIGDLWKDRKMLAENSPARHAEKISVPILLIHGNNDVVVDVSQSKKMANALRKNGKQHEYVEFENGDHHLSLYVNRLAFLEKTEEFLDECLNQR